MRSSHTSSSFFRPVSYALALVASSSLAYGQGKLGAYLTPDKAVAGNIVTVQPPEEITKYLAKVDDAARKDPEWFAAHSKTARPGVPLPFDPKLGLTEEEYAEYLDLWGKRSFTSLEKVSVMLTKSKDDLWQVKISGTGMAVQLMRYNAETDTWISSNGELKRIKDINADPDSILGAWKGQEWKFEKEDPFVRAKENIAMGKDADNHGMIVYRYQEVSPQGRRIFDKSMVIRFSPVK